MTVLSESVLTFDSNSLLKDSRLTRKITPGKSQICREERASHRKISIAFMITTLLSYGPALLLLMLSGAVAQPRKGALVSFQTAC